MVEAARELRGRPAGPNPGVLTPWDMANEVLVLAGRPVVVTGFGPYPDPAAFWETVKAYSVGEEALLPWLEGRRVGWVVAGAANLFGRVRSADALIPFVAGDFDPRWLRARPRRRSSSAVLASRRSVSVTSAGSCRSSPRPARWSGLTTPLPVIWLYEVVAGAEVTGRRRPALRVVLEIPLREHGRPHTWRAWSPTPGPTAAGRMRVPLPTDLGHPDHPDRPGPAPGGRRPGAGPSSSRRPRSAPGGIVEALLAAPGPAR